MTFAGFPRRVRYTPVPNQLFGPLLEQIDDLAELKCILRVIWLLHQKRGFPRFVTRGELLADRTLAGCLAVEGEATEELDRALTRAVQRGALATGAIEQKGSRVTVYALNTESDRTALARSAAVAPTEAESPDLSVGEKAEPETWETPPQRPNVFALYEENIGMLTPMVADELREAEELYPPQWIEEAIREAISQNKRSWRYVARILERWEQEGRADGGAGRDPQKAGRKRYY